MIFGKCFNQNVCLNDVFLKGNYIYFIVIVKKRQFCVRTINTCLSSLRGWSLALEKKKKSKEKFVIDVFLISGVFCFRFVDTESCLSFQAGSFPRLDVCFIILLQSQVINLVQITSDTVPCFHNLAGKSLKFLHLLHQFNSNEEVS